MRRGLTIAGKYTLLSQIGRGGMGSVWLARNELVEREFAIKLLNPTSARDPKIRERFLREARIPGRARHANIVEVLDVGMAPELDNLAFMVMELLDGVPLDLAIRALGGLPLRLALLVGAAIGRALEASHACGVLHRDLKPANVFLHRSRSGHLVPKLVDFGISKVADPGPGGDFEMELTKAGTVLGSPLYMSPEQASGARDLDGRSDVHALGVTLYFAIAGKSPFTSKRFDALVDELTSEARPRLGDVAAVPEGVSALVSKAFARDREARFQSAGELVAAIEAELVAMGPGPSLETRASVEEIFGRLRAAGVPVAEHRVGQTSSPSYPHASPAPAVAASAPRSAPSIARSSRGTRVGPLLAVALGVVCLGAASAIGVGLETKRFPVSTAAAAAVMHASPAVAPTEEMAGASNAPAEPPAPPAHAGRGRGNAPSRAVAVTPSTTTAKAAPSNAAPGIDELPQTRW